MSLRSTASRFNVPRRIRVMRERMARQDKALALSLAKLDKQSGQINDLSERLTARLSRHEASTKALSNTVVRLEKRLAACEAKVERAVHYQDAVAVTGDAAAVATAQDVVDVVQREHEQIRVRFQVITRYEERLRRVEALLEGAQPEAERRP